jgi:hypothetical protein
LQSGERVTRLDELQDIDELQVVEVRWFLMQSIHHLLQYCIKASCFTSSKVLSCYLLDMLFADCTSEGQAKSAASQNLPSATNGHASDGPRSESGKVVLHGNCIFSWFNNPKMSWSKQEEIAL